MLKRKPKKRRTPNPLKVSTRSAVKKGPARDKEHLASVRQQLCIMCQSDMARGMRPGSGRVQAHHVRSIAPRTMGVRVSDYLTVPLCAEHHTILHAGNEYRFWYNRHVDPRDFIRSFSKQGAAEIARITNGVTAGSPKDREL